MPQAPWPITSANALAGRWKCRSTGRGSRWNRKPGMAEAKKNALNVQGRYYVTWDCLACAACQDAAPNNFRFGDDGMSHVFKQPTSPDEKLRCSQALLECPLQAI